MNHVMRILSMLLVLGAIVSLGSGLITAESAPQQAVVVAQSCFIAILARIAQASAHNLDKK